MIRVSDIITEEEINNWANDEVVCVTAGVGVGKSFFVKNVLYKYAKRNNKKILMLIHRTSCVDQFQAEIERDEKDDVIDIMTYQKIEHTYRNKQEFDFSQYEYICVDEYHYFLSVDVNFNHYLDLSLSKILEQDSVRIFMSATGQHVKDYLEENKRIEIKEYNLPVEFNFVEKLGFFNCEKTIEELIESAIRDNKKSIFFLDSATQAYELYCKFKDYSLFNCGKGDKHYKHVDKDKINNMLANERFEELILITTCALSTGVNLIDLTLKQIVCSVQDSSTLLQCVGRKRPQSEDDNIELYIRSISNQQLGGKFTQLSKKVQMAEYLMSHTVKEYVEMYGRENDKYHIVYDDIVDGEDIATKKVNELILFKFKIDMDEIEAMRNLGDFGYCKHMAKLLGFYNEQEGFNYMVIEEEKTKLNLEQYLLSITDKKLLKDDQNELIEKVQLKDARGRIQKSTKLLNAYFAENNLKYMIVAKQSSTLINGKKKNYRYWIVLNDVLN